MPLDQAIPNSAVPTKIERLTELSDSDTPIGVGVLVSWSSGHTATLSGKTLRRHCPCATCLELNRPKETEVASEGRNRLKIISAGVQAECNLLQILPVGNYAINIIWGDRHDTGIYPFDTLRELCDLHKE